MTHAWWGSSSSAAGPTWSLESPWLVSPLAEEGRRQTCNARVISSLRLNCELVDYRFHRLDSHDWSLFSISSSYGTMEVARMRKNDAHETEAVFDASFSSSDIWRLIKDIFDKDVVQTLTLRNVKQNNG